MDEKHTADECPKNVNILLSIQKLTDAMEAQNKLLEKNNDNFDKLLDPENGIIVKHERLMAVHASKINGLTKFNKRILAAAGFILTPILTYLGKHLIEGK